MGISRSLLFGDGAERVARIGQEVAVHGMNHANREIRGFRQDAIFLLTQFLSMVHEFEQNVSGTVQDLSVSLAQSISIGTDRIAFNIDMLTKSIRAFVVTCSLAILLHLTHFSVFLRSIVWIIFFGHCLHMLHENVALSGLRKLSISKKNQRTKLPNIPVDAKWSQEPIVITDQLSDRACSLTIDQRNGIVYIADSSKNRILSWNPKEKRLQEIVSNLNLPTSICISEKSNSIIFTDYQNRRVAKYSLQDTNAKIETIIDDISCWGLVLDEDDTIYVSDVKKHNIQQYSEETRTTTIIAGSRGWGSDSNHLNFPTSLVIDDLHSIYITDYHNHRVVKWKQGAREGLLVAGHDGIGTKTNQLKYPNGIVIDAHKSLYVADRDNNRILRYRLNAEYADVIISTRMLRCPLAMVFDSHGNMYVTDENCRLLFFSIEKD